VTQMTSRTFIELLAENNGWSLHKSPDGSTLTMRKADTGNGLTVCFGSNGRLAWSRYHDSATGSVDALPLTGMRARIHEILGTLPPELDEDAAEPTLYLITFTRLNRRRMISPVTFPAENAEDLAERIQEYITNFNYFIGRTFRIALSLETMTGSVIVNESEDGGSFLIQEQERRDESPEE
jgi:hypothetical protein